MLLTLLAPPVGVAGAHGATSRPGIGCADEEPADPDLAPLCPAKAEPVAERVLRRWRTGKLAESDTPPVPYERVRFVRCREVGASGTVACRYRRARDGARVVVSLLADEYGHFSIGNLVCVKAGDAVSPNCEPF